MKNFIEKHNIDPKKILTSALLGFLFTLLMLILYWGTVFPDPSADAEIFTRLTRELPSYSPSADWIRIDRPDLHWSEPYMPDKIFDDAYEKPVWIHPPLANILAWPFVKLIKNERLLKIIPALLFLGSLYLVYLTLKNRGTKPWQLLVCFLPVPLMTTAMYGVPYFYHDAFMVPLLALSMWLISKKSNWKYLVITALVLTKTNAAIFLIPLALWDRNWRIILPGIGFFVWVGVTWLVTNNPFYIMNHWSTMSGYIKIHYEEFLVKNIGKAILYSGYYIYVPVLVVSIIKSIRLRGEFYAPVFGVVGLMLASWAIIPYQMAPILLALPIMVSTLFKTRQRQEND